MFGVLNRRKQYSRERNKTKTCALKKIKKSLVNESAKSGCLLVTQSCAEVTHKKSFQSITSSGRSMKIKNRVLTPFDLLSNIL